jgi:hypothetical protein
MSLEFDERDRESIARTFEMVMKKFAAWRSSVSMRFPQRKRFTI